MTCSVSDMTQPMMPPTIPPNRNSVGVLDPDEMSVDQALAIADGWLPGDIHMAASVLARELRRVGP